MGGGGSRAAQARAALLAAIRDGAFADGRLPPESELAARLGVSRTTLRAALQALADDGLISRRRRSGTVVTPHGLRASMRLNRLAPFTTLVEQSGHVASVDEQEHAEVAASPAVADALGVPLGTPCVRVERLLRAGGAPAIWIADLVPAAALGGAEPRAADSTFALLAAHGLGPVDYTVSEIVPRAAEPGMQLALEPGTPYVELRETHFSHGHDPIAHSVIAVDDRLVRFSLLRREL